MVSMRIENFERKLMEQKSHIGYMIYLNYENNMSKTLVKKTYNKFFLNISLEINNLNCSLPLVL